MGVIDLKQIKLSWHQVKQELNRNNKMKKSKQNNIQRKPSKGLLKIVTEFVAELSPLNFPAKINLLSGIFFKNNCAYL